MSKKIGMVAFLSSASGISVISNIGPTMPGMKQILFWPAKEEGQGHMKQFHDGQTGPAPGNWGKKERRRKVKTGVNSSVADYQETGSFEHYV